MILSLRDSLATIEAGRRIGVELMPGTVLALTGPLGAGKTHLATGIVAGVGSPGPVTSPTFTLVHEYRGGRVPVFHFDLYRLESEEALLEIGWDDYLDAGGITIVEWADRFPDLIPAGARWLRLSHEGQGRILEDRRSDDVDGSIVPASGPAHRNNCTEHEE